MTSALRNPPHVFVRPRLVKVEDRGAHKFFMNDVCSRCGEEFGDHKNRAPHASVKGSPACEGFAYGKPGRGTGEFS